ncbi:uncharacterized protein LOC143181505 [Calliopsis andreniformis]|uniref:uncharacterized protein LOC143181505 n=1 Tax=Calliopsis andreniformis TaxID=337506 RepID=UPI003FCCE5FE
MLTFLYFATKIARNNRASLKVIKLLGHRAHLPPCWTFCRHIGAPTTLPKPPHLRDQRDLTVFSLVVPFLALYASVYEDPGKNLISEASPGLQETQACSNRTPVPTVRALTRTRAP